VAIIHEHCLICVILFARLEMVSTLHRVRVRGGSSAPFSGGHRGVEPPYTEGLEGGGSPPTQGFRGNILEIIFLPVFVSVFGRLLAHGFSPMVFYFWLRN